MRVNVGCGEFPAAGWTNLDLTHDAADIRWDVRDGLPPEVTGEVERIYFGHVLEHLAVDEIVPVLRKVARQAPGAAFAIVGPDCDRVSERDPAFKAIRYGGGRWVGDVHQWRSTETATVALCERAGLTVAVTEPAKLKADGWPVVSEVAWQFALEGRFE